MDKVNQWCSRSHPLLCFSESSEKLHRVSSSRKVTNKTAELTSSTIWGTRQPVWTHPSLHLSNEMIKTNALTLPNWKFPYYNTDPCQNENSSKLVKWVCVLTHFSRVQLFVTPWTAAHQAPQSKGFSRQEYWSGLPCPPPGDLPKPRIKPVSLMSSLHWQAGSLPLAPPGRPT